jgi:hypothetical protein
MRLFVLADHEACAAHGMQQILREALINFRSQA